MTHSSAVLFDGSLALDTCDSELALFTIPSLLCTVPPLSPIQSVREYARGADGGFLCNTADRVRKPPLYGQHCLTRRLCLSVQSLLLAAWTSGVPSSFSIWEREI